MHDLMMIAAGVAAFALTYGFLVACDRLGRR